MPEFDYYIQERGEAPSLRRYELGSMVGERWDPADRQWTANCAPRSSCIISTDRRLTAEEAEQRFPGCTQEKQNGTT